jgi:hypothetical protein
MSVLKREHYQDRIVSRTKHERLKKKHRMAKGRIALSLLIIALGVGWLLTAQGFLPGINWIWTLCLGISGVVTFVMCGGIDKVSIVVGPFFLASSVLSVLRQSGQLSENTEMPIIVILVGVLLLLAQLPLVPTPAWLKPMPQSDL